jgi:ABC-type multidrug transport system fused ATPase/permease subunit
LDKKAARLSALQQQLTNLEKRIESLKAVSDRYSWIRLGIFIAGVVFSIAVFYTAGPWLGTLAIILSLVVFNVVAYYHRRIDYSINRHKVWLKLKTIAIARLTLDWEKLPAPAIMPENRTSHPFETDLDITGERSLHRLIDTSVSIEGSQRLRDWLCQTEPDAPAIFRRQKLVQELAPLTLFRNKLLLNATLAAQEGDGKWEGKKLLEWLKRSTPAQFLLPTFWLLSGLALLDLLLFGLSITGLFPNFLWIFTFLLYGALFQLNGRLTAGLLDDAYILRDGLMRLRAVLKYLEVFTYHNQPHLKELCQPFLDRANRPSAQLKRSSRVAYGAIMQKSYVWVVLNALFPLRYYLAYRLNRCKQELSVTLPVWLEVWFELEALNSLASFSYLNPEYIFPEIATTEGQIVFEATQLGHPLIPKEQKVCNDFTLDERGEIVIITGSNMSGKSSFLRTLGTNLCLTYAGGPVNAVSFEAALFRLFTCIRVSDSVTDGLSYFYAEVKRLRALLDELERPDPLPVFFLIDEIFRGTNNRERLIGSRSYLRALAARNGVGVVSTHDLELIRLADELPQVRNYHFREIVQDGVMVFDYKLRPGPSPTTNALKIMQLEGLPVEGD